MADRSNRSPRSDLEWVTAVLGGATPGESRPYLAQPSLEHLQSLFPLSDRRATARALHRVHDARPLSQRILGLGAQVGALGGQLERLGGEVVHLPPFGIEQRLARALGEPSLLISVSIGPRRRNRKPVLQLLRPNGVLIGFAKVAWSPLTTEFVTNEARWLRHVDGRLPPGLRTPAVLAHLRGTSGADRADLGAGTDIVVTSPVPTPLTSYRRCPLSPASVAALARLGTQGRLSLGEQWDTGWRPGGTKPDDDGRLGELVDLDRVVERHAETLIEWGLWHGDLTPWNTATAGGVTSIWDWEFAAAPRPVGFDALHMAFEEVRRQGIGFEAAALDMIERSAAAVLNALPGGPVTTSVDAVIDLYLLELLCRELRLEGQGWEPNNLAPLVGELTSRLNRRLTAP